MVLETIAIAAMRTSHYEFIWLIITLFVLKYTECHDDVYHDSSEKNFHQRA